MPLLLEDLPPVVLARYRKPPVPTVGSWGDEGDWADWWRNHAYLGLQRKGKVLVRNPAHLEPRV
jgi:hypothetical protein